MNGGNGGSANTVDPTTAPPADNASDTPRVRQDFPETLYVNPSIITGPDGTASVNVDMADSITEWRVSTLAHTLRYEILTALGRGVGIR